MTDDRTAIEVRLHEAFRREGLPPAPSSLFDALDRVAETAATRPSVGAGRRHSGRLPWAALGIAAVMILGGGLALFGTGSPRPIAPVPSTSPSAPGTVRITYDPIWTAEVQEDAAVIARIAEILQQRLDAVGITGATARTQGRSIVVELPADAGSDEARRLIGQIGRVAFVPVRDSVGRGTPLDETTHRALFGSEHIANADVASGQAGNVVLQLRLDATGTALFADYTRSHVGSYFAITLDGLVVLAPMITSEIPTGDVEVSFGPSDGLSAEELSRLAAIITIGPLPVPILEVAAAVGSQEPGPTPLVASPAPTASPAPS